MNDKVTSSEQGSVARSTQFFHPGIKKEKNAIIFDAEARAVLKEIVIKLLEKLDKSSPIIWSHPNAIQRVVDQVISEDWDSKTKNHKFIDRVRLLMSWNATPKQAKAILEKAVKKDTDQRSEDIYFHIDGRSFPAPLLLWPNDKDLPIDTLVDQLITSMNNRAKNVGVLKWGWH